MVVSGFAHTPHPAAAERKPRHNLWDLVLGLKRSQRTPAGGPPAPSLWYRAGQADKDTREGENVRTSIGTDLHRVTQVLHDSSTVPLHPGWGKRTYGPNTWRRLRCGGTGLPSRRPAQVPQAPSRPIGLGPGAKLTVGALARPGPPIAAGTRNLALAANRPTPPRLRGLPPGQARPGWAGLGQTRPPEEERAPAHLRTFSKAPRGGARRRDRWARPALAIGSARVTPPAPVKARGAQGMPGAGRKGGSGSGRGRAPPCGLWWRRRSLVRAPRPPPVCTPSIRTQAALGGRRDRRGCSVFIPAREREPGWWGGVNKCAPGTETSMRASSGVAFHSASMLYPRNSCYPLHINHLQNLKVFRMKSATRSFIC